MLKILPEIKALLQRYPHLRDSDEKLMANIWYRRIPNIAKQSALNVLGMLSNKKLPSYESISRCRRKLQEEIPSLRGEMYNLRHKRTEEVKEEIKEMEDMV